MKIKMKEHGMANFHKNVLVDGLATSFNNTVLMVKAPFKAIKAGSMQPIYDAYEENESNTRAFIARHS